VFFGVLWHEAHSKSGLADFNNRILNAVNMNTYFSDILPKSSMILHASLQIT
jgi:hypothetical protein